MTILFWTLFILMIIFILIFLYGVYYVMELNKNKEQWTNYMRLPFDYLSTGATPFDVYEKPLYREPYMYPQKFYQSYPLPTMQYYPLL